MAIHKIISALAVRIRKSLELRKYNDFNISHYFRKQGAQIGENNRIEVRHLSIEPYLISIGNHCTIGPQVVFLNHDGGTWLFSDEDPSLQRFGTIEIKDNCFIGYGAIIMLNVKIGPSAIVGAGSVVTKDVPEGAIVAGNPAVQVSTIGKYRQKVIENWKLQKPPDYFLQKGLIDKKMSPAQIQDIKNRDLQLLKTHLMELYWGKSK